MQEVMGQASRAVLNGFTISSDAKIVRYALHADSPAQLVLSRTVPLVFAGGHRPYPRYWRQ